MAAIAIVDGLPTVAVTLQADGQTLALSNVVIDTGSAGCLFKTDDLETIGVRVERTDYIHTIRGIGGREWVVEKQIAVLKADPDLSVSPFTIEIASFDYGLAIDGILGMDFLLAVKAVIDLDTLTLTKRS